MTHKAAAAAQENRRFGAIFAPIPKQLVRGTTYLTEIFHGGLVSMKVKRYLNLIALLADEDEAVNRSHTLMNAPHYPVSTCNVVSSRWRRQLQWNLR